MDYQKACRALKIVEAVMGTNYIKYFLCFGNIVHLIRDKSIEPDKDIDIGVFYECADPNIIIRGFKHWEYNVDGRIDNDLDHKPLYLSFVHTGNQGLPPVDVFFWYLHEKIRYHTYDTKQEKKAIPSEYVFKGVKADLLPDPKLGRQDPLLIRSFFGPWNKPYFQFEVPIPLMYGSLMDTWYPNWLKPQKMESMSPYVVRMKSCKGWAGSVKGQLEASRVEYEEKRKAL